MGLLLSTPLTVCLAVLGKYVPGLKFFATLLGEEAELEPDVRFYQRLISLDREGSMSLVEEALKQWPRAEVFDRVLVPTLVRAERDAEQGELEDQEQAFVWQVVGEVVESLEGVPETGLQSLATSAEATAREVGKSAPPAVEVVGVAVVDTSDVLVLKMLAQLLAPSGCSLEIIENAESPLQVAEQVAEKNPKLVVLSHVPPSGLNQARYLVRRLRAQCSGLSIMVGRWGEGGGAASAADRLVNVGASHVTFTLAEAREWILSKALPEQEAGATSPASESLAVGHA